MAAYTVERPARSAKPSGVTPGMGQGRGKEPTRRPQSGRGPYRLCTLEPVTSSPGRSLSPILTRLCLRRALRGPGHGPDGRRTSAVAGAYALAGRTALATWPAVSPPHGGMASQAHGGPGAPPWLPGAFAAALPRCRPRGRSPGPAVPGDRCRRGWGLAARRYSRPRTGRQPHLPAAPGPPAPAPGSSAAAPAAPAPAPLRRNASKLTPAGTPARCTSAASVRCRARSDR